MSIEPARTWASDEAARAWRAGTAKRQHTLAAATEAMLDAAGVAPNQRVLDLAAGTGDQTLPAAQRVGPRGSVLATDISPNMLAEAADAAREAGLNNVETLAADASALDLPEATFDAAICRFGFMFMPDVHAALVGVRRVLKPGAKLAALVWSSEARNPYIGLQLALLREMDRLPPSTSLAQTVALGGPGQLEQALAAAGFTDVRVRPIATPREFLSAEDAMAAMRGSSPAQGQLIKAMSAPEQEQYTVELVRRLAGYVQADGRCILPGEALLGVGTN